MGWLLLGYHCVFLQPTVYWWLERALLPARSHRRRLAHAKTVSNRMGWTIIGFVGSRWGSSPWAAQWNSRRCVLRTWASYSNWPDRIMKTRVCSWTSPERHNFPLKCASEPTASGDKNAADAAASAIKRMEAIARARSRVESCAIQRSRLDSS